MGAMPRLQLVLILGASLLAPVRAAAEEPAAILQRLAAQAAERGALRAGSGRCFLAADLRAAGAPAWNARAEGQADPLAVIGALHDRLAAAGIALLAVPVPNRVLLHGAELDPALAGADLAAGHRAALAALAGRGVAAVDLLEPFQALAAAGTDPSCRLDSHWSPEAMERAAALVAARIAAQPWHGAAARAAGTTTPVALQARGDLAGLLGLGEEEVELLRLSKVALAGQPPASDRASPVLVLGDSHALVYARPIPGGIAARGAGFPDHLALHLGLAVDNAANQGDGINQARETVARRPAGWAAAKRCVVWVFAARAFTQTADGWQDVPLP